MNGRAMTMVRLLLISVLLLAAATAAADAPETLPPGKGKYVMVLRHPRPVAPGQAPEKITEPDVAKHGGQVVDSWDNFRVLYLPPAAAKHIRGHKSVDHLQRVWMGEPLDQWDETEVAGARNLDAAAQSEPDPTWDSGDYAYDGSGNIKSIGADTYTYDSVGRIKSAVVNGTTQTFEYDAFGNLTKLQTGSALAPIAVDSTTNRLANESYDAAGNMTSRAGDQHFSGSTFLYDSLGMMVWRAGKTGNRRMLYTADDERIGTYITETMARWKIRGLDDKVLREFVSYNDVWYWTEDYLYAGGQLVGAEVPWTQNQGPNLGRRHFHTDHLGSVRLITTTDRITISRHDYYPFGLEQTLYYQEEQNFGGQGNIRPEPMRFTSHERDYLGYWNAYDEEQLDYMHARHYDPRAGRFLSVDPTWESADLGRPQSWNRYSYVLNNPVNLTDPDGKCPYCIDPVELGRAAWATAAEFTTKYVVDAESTGASADLPKDPVERAKYIEQRLQETTYKRPSGATTPEQRASVQDKPCEVCGKDDGGKRVAGHKKALVQEHYETGTIDKQRMKAVDAVRPECPTCSAREGAAMSRYSRTMKKMVKEAVEKLVKWAL